MLLISVTLTGPSKHHIQHPKRGHQCTKSLCSCSHLSSIWTCNWCISWYNLYALGRRIPCCASEIHCRRIGCQGVCKAPLKGPPCTETASEKTYTVHTRNNFLLEISNPTSNPNESIGNTGSGQMWLFLAEYLKDCKSLYNSGNPISNERLVFFLSLM